MFRDRARMELERAGLDTDEAFGEDVVLGGDIGTVVADPLCEEANVEDLWGISGALGLRADGRRRDDDDEGDEFYDDDFDDDDEEEEEENEEEDDDDFDDFDDDFGEDDNAEVFADDE